ncbi:MAG: hypothetical protein U0X39_04145 [Bacteroidales bacterium]
MKKIIIILAIIASAYSLKGQTGQQGQIKREVTLYNPYKPTVPEAVKKSFQPDMTDTVKIKPEFRYEVSTYPFMPEYVISPLKPAALMPEALPKLYRNYINAGLGNYFTPLAELSLASERSKKGAIGVYASHFSTNSKIQLQDLRKVYAGYMDNDVLLYGKKFFRKSLLDGSIDFSQRTRYAYGYDTAYTGYDPAKKEIKANYYNIGANIGLRSTDLDSSSLSYNGNFKYYLFTSSNHYYQQTVSLTAELEKMIKEFYAGLALEASFFIPSDSIAPSSRYLVSLNPFVKKSRQEWNVKLGFKAVMDKGPDMEAKAHLYPDLKFGFNIIPDYLGFFASLTGDMQKNEPYTIVNINPYLLPGATLYNIPNTNYSLVVKAGLKGESGLDRPYEISASYSLVDNFLLFSNYAVVDGALAIEHGNHFIPLTDQAEILNVHGETGGRINDKFTFEGRANYWKYTLTDNTSAWNMPDWDGSLRIKYNLRDKIIAVAGIGLTGPRDALVTTINNSTLPATSTGSVVQIPAETKFNLMAEYRYTKILSFWARMENIGFSRQFEWAYYPSQKFLFLVGFSYSL